MFSMLYKQRIRKVKTWPITKKKNKTKNKKQKTTNNTMSYIFSIKVDPPLCGPVRIWVRIGPQHPLACRKMSPQKPRPRATTGVAR
jgi:hypothetical protein